MNRSIAFFGLLAFCACSLTAVQLTGWNTARAHHAAAERLAHAAASDATELARLRTAAETRIFGEPPAEDFVDRVNRTLAAIGLPPTTASNITREADRGVAGPGNDQRRRDMRIELRPISPPDLGRFLAAWNADNPAWTARQITLRKNNDRRASPEDYHATLTLSAEYTQTAAPSASAAPTPRAAP
jgi:hypothetical protein